MPSLIRNKSPSARKIAEEFSIDSDTAKEVRKLWKVYKIDEVLDKYVSTRDWFISCYHKPYNREVRMNAIAELLRPDGVAGVGTLGRSRRTNQWVYTLNTGDIYNATLAFVGGRMFITTDADLLTSGYVRETTNDDFLER